jgi:RNA polymerase sigma factor (sigma-70 family)
MQEMDDMALLREYAARNSEAAFKALVSRRVNFVYSAAMRQVRDPHLAQEVTQAVFIILAQKAGRISNKTILSGWLFKTTRFAALAQTRAAVLRQQREQEAHMQSELQQTAPDPFWEQMSPLLDEALATLGEADRQAVLLRFFENKSLAEVGSHLGTGEDTARKRVSRALEKLHCYFTKRGVFSTTAIIAGAISANSVQVAPVVLAKSVTAAAAAKGAAASGSTLTLIKGALKLMAWTKVKTTIVVGATTIALTLGVGYFGFFDRTHSRQLGRLKLPVGQVTPAIGFGVSHGIILASDGSLWAWGENDLGWPALGLGKINKQAFLRRVGNENDWVNIAVGNAHNLAVKADGTLWAWGENARYELGDGTKTTRSTPVHSLPGNDWKQAAAGLEDTFAIKNDGTLWAWGINWAGQLGIGTVKDSPVAVQVGSATWKKVWAGGTQSVGIQSDGSLWAWGTGAHVANTIPPRSKTYLVPECLSSDTNWVDATVSLSIMFAIKSDGTLWAWGANAHVYTGVHDEALDAKLVQVGTNSDWQACSTAPFYLVLIKKDGSVWAMDASDHSTLGYRLKWIDLQKDIVAFGGGRGIGAAVTRDGEVWTWGKVIGEYVATVRGSGKNVELVPPKYTVLDKPWQLSNVDPADTSTK